MSHKKKTRGAQRKDKYYAQAKVEGYRARSAYKLIQLNTKYGFLQKSLVCVDLCAAPGSWMQVAKKFMPLSSVVVGVDLYPINPMQGAISIVGDITKEKVRQEIKATLKTWKADLVLHDGSPKVGKNWLHDAYQQNVLTLHAFKLACELLQKGGTFLTKVFRSKDYFSLEYVFRKLFKKVEATKPGASRHESAEIFVLCQGYLAPAKVDPHFFSPKYVFQEIENDSQNKLNILKPLKGKPKAEGYEEGATTLFNKIPVSMFIEEGNFLDILQKASKFEFDDEALKNHKRTTPEIIDSCKDIKVLGRKDLRALLKWRKNIRSDMKAEKEAAEARQKELEKEEKKSEKDDEDKELEELDKQISDMKMEQAQEGKRDRKRKLKEKRKLREQQQLVAAIPSDVGPQERNTRGLFNLERLAQVQDIDTLLDQGGDQVLSDEEEEAGPDRPKYVRFKPGESRLDRTGRYYLDGNRQEIETNDDNMIDSGSDEEGLGLKDSGLPELMDGGDVGEDADASHPLVTDLVGDVEEEKRARKAELWFNQDAFKDLETEADEDHEVDAAISSFKAKGGVLTSTKKVEKKRMKRKIKKVEKGLKKVEKMKEEKKKVKEKEEEEEAEVARDAPADDIDNYETDSTNDSDSDDDNPKSKLKMGPQMPRAAVGAAGGGTLDPTATKKRKDEGLDEVGLALATQMIHSKKAKRDLMDAGWNRYMFGDEDDLPKFFVKHEMKYNKPDVEVKPEDLRMYRDKNKDVNARTLKKVVEAKARKWRRTKKLMEKARKKAENITGNASMSEREKAQEIKRLYKKAMAPLKKKERQYVVTKKRSIGRKPRGIKGPYRMVDKRLKKDKRAVQKVEAKKGKKVGGGGSKARKKK